MAGGGRCCYAPYSDRTVLRALGDRRFQEVSIFSLLRRAWVPLVIIIVVLVGGFTVMRVRTFFGAPDPSFVSNQPAEDTEPFDPKVVTYEIYGSGTSADINYLDLDGNPQRIDGAALPWTLTLQTTNPTAFPNVVAQGPGDSISCRITVDDEVKDTNTSNGVSAQTFCLVKNA